MTSSSTIMSSGLNDSTSDNDFSSTVFSKPMVKSLDLLTMENLTRILLPIHSVQSRDLIKSSAENSISGSLHFKGKGNRGLHNKAKLQTFLVLSMTVQQCWQINETHEGSWLKRAVMCAWPNFLRIKQNSTEKVC